MAWPIHTKSLNYTTAVISQSRQIREFSCGGNGMVQQLDRGRAWDESVVERVGKGGWDE